MTYWLNGEWREEKAAIRIDDRGFLLGDGVFETILARNGAPAFLSAHWARLQRSLAALGIAAEAALPADPAVLIRDLCARAGLDHREAAVRVTVTRGAGPRGLAPAEGDPVSPTVLFTAAPMPTSFHGVRKLILSKRVRCAGALASRHKTLNYLEPVLARQDAARAGADDALLMNERGAVVCASAANLFVIEADGAIATPPLTDGALPGIVRGALIAAAERAGHAIREKSIVPERISDATLILTNSLIGVAPARLSGGEPAAPHPYLARLKSCYEDALSVEMRQQTDRS